MFFISDTLESKDRYAPQLFMEYVEGGDFLSLGSVFITEMKKLPLQSYITSLDERPDFIAYKIYGDTQFAWIIMLYNKCTDITNGTFSQGSDIRYPSITDIEKIRFTLNARKRAADIAKNI